MNVEELREFCLSLPGATEDILQAPYFARRKWVMVASEDLLDKREWENYLVRSYELVKAGLPKKTRDSIPGIPGQPT